MRDNLRGITARRLIHALQADGFKLKRTSGSHHLYQHTDGLRVVIAYHHPGDTFPIGALKGMIAAIGWTENDLERLGFV